MKGAKLRLQLTVAPYDAIDRAQIALADRLAALVERELHDADREVLRCAHLTLAFRLQQPR